MAMFIDVKVVPSSGKNLCVVDKNKNIKCYLKSAPEKGKANDELICLLSKILNIPKNFIEITFGKTSRKKRIKINFEISSDDIKKKIDPNYFKDDERERQCHIFSSKE